MRKQIFIGTEAAFVGSLLWSLFADPGQTETTLGTVFGCVFVISVVGLILSSVWFYRSDRIYTRVAWFTLFGGLLVGLLCPKL